MAEYLIQGSTLQGIADAIRSKTKSTNSIAVSEMTEAIGSIPVADRDIVQPDDTYILYTRNDAGEITHAKMVNCTHLGGFAGLSSLESVDFSESPNITSVSPYAFAGCSSIRSISIPDTVTDIGERAFYGCTLLESVNIPDGVTTIRPYTFGECILLSSVNIPDTVGSIGDYAFYHAGITDITIPSSVYSIGAYAFYNCTNLDSVTIQNGVSIINHYAFAYCTALYNITIPDSVKTLSYRVFQSCTGLNSVTLGSGLTMIRDNCFVSTRIQYVTFRVTTGWFLAANVDATSGTSISSSSLKVTSTAAQYLKKTYVSKIWKRS